MNATQHPNPHSVSVVPWFSEAQKNTPAASPKRRIRNSEIIEGMAHFVRQDKPYFEGDLGSWVFHGANGRNIPLWGNPHIFEETGWVSILPPRKFYHQCRHSHLLTEQTNPKTSHVSMPPAFACHVSSSALPSMFILRVPTTFSPRNFLFYFVFMGSKQQQNKR